MAIASCIHPWRSEYNIETINFRNKGMAYVSTSKSIYGDGFYTFFNICWNNDPKGSIIEITFNERIADVYDYQYVRLIFTRCEEYTHLEEWVIDDGNNAVIKNYRIERFETKFINEVKEYAIF